MTFSMSTVHALFSRPVKNMEVNFYSSFPASSLKIFKGIAPHMNSIPSPSSSVLTLLSLKYLSLAPLNSKEYFRNDLDLLSAYLNSPKTAAGSLAYRQTGVGKKRENGKH